MKGVSAAAHHAKDTVQASLATRDLGRRVENNLRKSLILSQGDFAIFFTRPLSVACLAIALFLLLSPLLPALRKRREVVAMEEVA